MKKRLSIFVLALVAVLILPAVGGVSGGNGTYASTTFNRGVDFKQFSTKDGLGTLDTVYDGDTHVNSIYFNSTDMARMYYQPTSGSAITTQATDNAILYTSRVLGGFTAEFGAVISSGYLHFVYGVTALDWINGGTSISIGRESYIVNSTTTPYSKTVEGELSVSITVGDSAYITIKQGEDTLASSAITATAEDGYVGFASKTTDLGEFNLTYAELKQGASTLVFDTFTDDKTMSTVNQNATDYKWAARSLGDANSAGMARGLRMVSGNELYVTNGKWPAEVAYTGYEMVGGIGAEYTQEFDVTIFDSQGSHALAVGVGSNIVSAGIRSIDGMSANLRPELFPVFRVSSDKSTVALTTFNSSFDPTIVGSPQAFEQDRKMRVSVNMRQTGEELTEVKISFSFANDILEQVSTVSYEISRGIKGYFTLIPSCDFVLGNLRIYQGNTYVGGDDFSATSSLDEFAESWFVGKAKAVHGDTNNADTMVQFFSFGKYKNGAVVANSKTENGTKIMTREAVPAFDQDYPRTTMFETSLSLSFAGYEGGRVSLLFGTDNSSRLDITPTAITAYEGGIQLGSPYTVSLQSIELKVVAGADKVLKVNVGAESVQFTYASLQSFAGRQGIELNGVLGTTLITLREFELTVSGVITTPTLEIAKPSFVPIGTPTSLAPLSMQDENYSGTDLELTITITDEEGEQVFSSTTQTTYTFTEAGYFTLHYRLENASGLFVEDGFTTRAIHRGTSVGAIDKLVATFEGKNADGWDIDGGNVAEGSVTLLGGSMQSQGKLNYFMMFFTVNAIQGEFELFFGNCAGQEHAFAVVFKSASIEVRNLLNDAGTSTYLLPHKLNNGDTVKVEVMEGTVSIYVKSAAQPNDFLSRVLTTAYFEADRPSTFGTIGFSVESSSMLSLSNIRIYSLYPTIEISDENYVEPQTNIDGEQPKNNTLLIVLCICIPVGVIALLATAYFVVNARLKKQGKTVLSVLKGKGK